LHYQNVRDTIILVLYYEKEKEAFYLMLEFHKPQLSDKLWVDELLRHSDYRGSEYNFTNLFVWNGVYGQKLARLGEFLLVHACNRAGCSYFYPAGRGDVKEAIEALRRDAAERGEPFRLICMTLRQTEEVERIYPGKFEFTQDRDGSDYLYAIDRLADLSGKKLHNKRNHINRFEENNLGWTYEEITAANLSECTAMNSEWYRRSLEREGPDETADLAAESKALGLAMEHYEPLGLKGGLIRVNGEVVAFTMGDPLSSDTFDVHFEKAYSDLQGAYTIINREFARWIREHYPNIRYLNREDDMGIAGLRKAKESYYPDLMAEKHVAVWID
jgi:hypothetical protein